MPEVRFENGCDFRVSVLAGSDAMTLPISKRGSNEMHSSEVKSPRSCRFLLLYNGFSIARQSISALSTLQFFTALVLVVSLLLLLSSFSVAYGPS